MSRCLSLAAVVAMVALAGCDPPVPDNGAEVKIKIYTWWTQGGEKEALDVLEARNRIKHPHVSLSQIEAASGQEATERLNAVLYTTNERPDTFQTNGGSRLLSQVVSRSASGSGRPLELLQLQEFPDLDQSVWKFVHPLISLRDGFYAVPLNLHRINNLYFSIPKLRNWLSVAGSPVDEFGKQDIPPSAQEFVDWALRLCHETSMANGPTVAVGLSDTFTLETLVFESLLSSVAIAASDLDQPASPFPPSDRVKFYEEFWKGKKPPNEEPNRTILDRTLRLTQKLWPCVTTSHPMSQSRANYTWTDSLDALLDARSSIAFVVMGDWATGYLQTQVKNEQTNERYAIGSDFGFTSFPGTESLFIYTTDTLTMTSVGKHPEETKDFLRTALEAKTQVAFSKVKGSIPAVQGTSEQDWDAPRRELILLLENTTDEVLKRSAAISGLLTPDIQETFFRGALQDALEAPDPVTGREILHHAFDNNYWLLERWAKTLEQEQ